MGDILIRMKKLKTPELLEALVEQKASGRGSARSWSRAGSCARTTSRPPSGARA